MKKALWGLAIFVVVTGVVLYPRIKSSWELHQTMKDLRESAAKERAIFEKAAQIVQKSISENGPASTEFSTAVNLVINNRDSGAAFDLLFKGHDGKRVTEAEHTALIELIIREKDAAVAKNTLKVIRLTDPQQSALELIAGM